VSDAAAQHRPALFAATWPALVVGAVALLACGAAAVFGSVDAILRSYLFAWVFWVGIAVGSLGVLMLHHLVGGAWGEVIRRPAEAAAMTLPLLAVLFIPIAFGLHPLFPWARADEVAQDALLQHRRPLFNVGAFLIRVAMYFAIWILIAWRLRSLSLREAAPQTTAEDDFEIHRRLRSASALGTVLYFITGSLFAVDLIMSRETDWYSSTFGWSVIMGQVLSGLCVLIVVLVLLHRDEPMNRVVDPDHFHDLGNLLQTVVVLWSYIAFAQFLVIWLGNTQEDIRWYVHRTHGLWRGFAAAIMLLHFAVPFAVLLSQDAKRSPRAMGWLAGALLPLRAMDVLWMVAPSSPTAEPHHAYWSDPVALFGIGGIWLAMFLWLLKRHPLLPVGDRVPLAVAEAS
jgi:hypothetical protein